MTRGRSLSGSLGIHKPSLSFCQVTIKCTRKGHLNKPGSVYGLKVLAVVLFQTKDVQKEVHKLFDSIPDDLRKTEVQHQHRA